VVRRRLGDRRGRPRFDVVGDLPGSLEAVLRLPLKNISRGGALIHSHVMLPPESIHTLRLDANGEVFTTQVRVKHVTDVTTSDGERTFLLGVEFVAMHPGLLVMIEKLATVVSGDGQTAGV
jgi:PilZ domain